MLCRIYKSPRRQEMYLYVDMLRDLADVPESLLAQFGMPEPVMSLTLTPERKLARASAPEVMASIRDKGYYLQMPPTMAELLARDGVNE